MAEKEERIFITTIDRAEDIDEFCVYGRDCMTRQEAIKNISSHLLMCDISTMDTDEIAEAALNALLGE